MRRILFTAIATAALAYGAAGAMAQTPVPNASGSQVTNSATYRATAYQNRSMRKRQVVKRRPLVQTTGSARAVRSSAARATPVQNASGSQVTNPETYRANAYQRRR
jgi:hypothetical protein